MEAHLNFKSILDTDSVTSGGDWIGQMVSHPLPINTPSNIKDIIWERHGIEIPIFEWNGIHYIRCSFQVYNEKKDVDSLMSALESIF